MCADRGPHKGKSLAHFASNLLKVANVNLYTSKLSKGEKDHFRDALIEKKVWLKEELKDYRFLIEGYPWSSCMVLPSGMPSP